MNNTCKVCNLTIQLMCRKNTGICSELCEKGYELTKKKRRRKK